MNSRWQRWGLVLCLLAVANAPAARAADELVEIATNAYIYAFPLVMIDITRQVSTNNEVLGQPPAQINQFRHAKAFPDAKFTTVVRPNADTLYSSLWFDVSQEPLVIDVGDSGGRYYLLQIMDAWTDTFAAPGKRTTGTGRQAFALTGPGWRGVLPPDVMEIKTPTPTGWIIGRTQTNGPADYAAVHRFQAGMSAAPLSKYGQPFTPVKAEVNPKIDRSPPVVQVEKMSAAEFFARFADLMTVNPPHANDYPIVHQMARLGIVPGKKFKMSETTAEARSALEQAPGLALKKIKVAHQSSGNAANGWRTHLTAIGTYGTDYLHRAGVAFTGLGANPIEDAVYPTAFADRGGQPLDSAAKYVLHFAKEEIPPVRAFWSLTVYNERQLFAENPINRFAIGDRDALKFNVDGSLDLYVQRESPGPAKEANWLPTPQSGKFTMGLRLYWPTEEVLDGEWKPPGVERVKP